MISLLYAVFFVSGFSALVFEALWFYRLGLVLGNTVWASSLTLSAFMVGLALGNTLASRPGRHLERPIATYALLEAGIAVTGVALVWCLPWLHTGLVQVLASLGPDSGVAHLVRVAVGFVLLVIPATSMGATLPILSHALSRSERDFGAIVGALYGWNTIGAVAGVLTVEILLIGWLGIRGSALFAGACNLCAAAGALAIGRALDGAHGQEEAPEEGDVAWGRLAPWLALAAIAGFTLMFLEILWFRTLAMFSPNSSMIFSLMLAVVLAGIGTGGLVAGRWSVRDEGASTFLPAIWLIAAVMVVFGLLFLPDAPVARLRDMLALFAALMFPVSLCSGILFTLLGLRIRSELERAAGAAAALTLSNTLGSALGPLLAGFVFLPGVGVEASYMVAVGLYAAGGLLAWWLVRPEDRRLPGLMLGMLAALVVVFPHGRLMAPVYELMAERADGEILAVREGVVETSILTRTSYLGEEHHLRLATNGYSMTATRVDARRYMRLYVWLPAALSERMERALLISFGVGQTAQELARSAAIDEVDVVDISADIVELSDLIYGENHPLRQDGVELFIEDGRHYLEVTDRTYDLITSEPPPPNAQGVVSLYTREYFELIRSRLSEGGLVTYWLPLHSLPGGSGVAVTSAFCEVFDDCSLWMGIGEELMLVGSRGFSETLTRERLARQWSVPEIADELEVTGFERPEQLLASFVADAEQLTEWTRGVAPLTDDVPHRILDVPELDDARADRIYATWTGQGDVPAERFASSSWIASIVPEPMRAGLAPYFAAHRLLNKAYSHDEWEGFGHPDPITLEDLEQADTLLERDGLRQPLLWLLGSDEQMRRIVSRAPKDQVAASPRWLFEWGVSALVEGRRDEALARLARVAPESEWGRRALELRLWTLRRAGRERERRELARTPRPDGASIASDADALFE